MAENLTQNVEDYLKAIYDLAGENGRAGTNQIAERLGVAPASVTGMLKKLSQPGAMGEDALIDYHKHRGAALTPSGEKAALEVVRHHRLLELFLHQILGYPWEDVHAEADRLEHFISEQFEERIAQVLGNPLRDPHGDPIPSRDLHLPEVDSMLLADSRPGQLLTICRVRSASPELLRFLGERGLVPQARLIVLDYYPLDQNLRLQVQGMPEPVTLGTGVTRNVLVQVETSLSQA